MNTINEKPIPEQFIANKEQRLQKEEVKRAEERCPHIIRKGGIDSRGNEVCTYDTCELNTKACLIEHGLYECYIWNQIKEEEL